MPVSPPRPKGPPLNALRAFEAAARLGGFVNAAQELSVTPGAVSQHIKTLEDWLGAPLFQRHAQGVALTALGEAAAKEFCGVFDAMGEAVRNLRAQARQKAIAIAAMPSVAQLWLSPRMPAIRAALPEVDISIYVLETRPNLSREIFDLSVFLDRPTGARNEIILAPDQVFPVCSANIATALRSGTDLQDFAWLHDTAWAADWQDWAAFADIPTRRGPQFSLYALALQEACNGAGIAIGHAPLVADMLANGALVAPFPDRLGSELSLNLCFAETGRLAGPVEKLVAMLRS